MNAYSLKLQQFLSSEENNVGWHTFLFIFNQQRKKSFMA